jgi:hypothetical protein
VRDAPTDFAGLVSKISYSIKDTYPAQSITAHSNSHQRISDIGIENLDGRKIYGLIVDSC